MQYNRRMPLDFVCQVTLRDHFNSIVTSGAHSVSINPRAAFTGASTVIASNGFAVFSDLFVNLPPNSTVLIWFSSADGEALQTAPVPLFVAPLTAVSLVHHPCDTFVT